MNGQAIKITPIEVRMIRCGQIFVTTQGDVCMKLAYAIGAPKSIVINENVRAADLGNGAIYEFSPRELVDPGPLAFELYQKFNGIEPKGE